MSEHFHSLFDEPTHNRNEDGICCEDITTFLELLMNSGSSPGGQDIPTKPLHDKLRALYAAYPGKDSDDTAWLEKVESIMAVTLPKGK